MKQSNINRIGGLALVLLFTASSALAQFSLGFDFQLPMGSFGDGFYTGFGGSARYDKGINDNLSWTAGIGYASYGSKASIPGASLSASIVPITGGIKYYFTESNKGFYGGADLGVYIVTASVSVSGFSVSSSDSKFGFSPGVGYRVGSFDISGRYNIISDFNNIGFRVAYIFGGN